MDDQRQWLLELAGDLLDREGGADTAHDIDHIARTMGIAETIHRREGGHLPTILAAVALHDVGQARERREGGDHAAIGAAMARDCLTGTRFPEDAIPAVQQAIREHRMTGEVTPQSLEARIVYDADKLDCLGAIGVARLFCMTGMLGQKVYTPTPAVPRPVSSTDLREMRKSREFSPGVEFDLLLADMPERLLTATGRELANERHAYMREFFDRLRREVEGEL